MNPNSTTELEIEEILQQVAFCAIPISWKSENPLPGVGERKSKFRGPGADYVEFVPFEDGDDPRHINWAMTARATDDDVLWRTVHEEEKEVKSVLFVKVGHSMDFGTQVRSKRQLAAQTAASILYALDKTRDKAGCIVYSRDAVQEDLRPKAAMSNLYEALTVILEADPYAESAIAKKGDGLSKALSGLPRDRSLVFIVSDFLDMSDKDWLELANAAVYHDVICVYIQDKRERELPPLPGLLGKIGGFYPLEDSDGKRRIIWNDAAARRKYTENFQIHSAAIIKELEERLCQSLVLSTEEGEEAISKMLMLFAGHI